MKIKIEIKNRWTGAILFEYEKENNTIKDTLIEAVKRHTCLSGADLYGADLNDADLSNAILYGADISNANLCDSDLSNATLNYAILCDANLCNADLCHACLYMADLSNTCLYGADLCSADLGYAHLCDVDIRDANLNNVDFYGANLHDVNLGGAKNVPYIPLACPSNGAFIGWKKVHEKLVKLEIPEDARRCSGTTQKCRCDKAKVLEITDIDGSNPIPEIENLNQTHHVLYKVGEMVYPDSFDDDRWNECSNGIHFFINKQEAINY